MNTADIETLKTMASADPDAAQQLFTKVTANEDRMAICQLLRIYTQDHDAETLVNSLGDLIDKARREGYALPE